MPGISVILGQSAPADYSSLLAAMCSRMRHHDRYSENRYVDADAALAVGRLSLGFVNPADQPASNEDGSLLAVLDGELYESEPLTPRPNRPRQKIRTGSHGELLGHGYETDGRQVLAQLQGCFAAAIWDRRNRRLVLTNDRFGMKPLYSAHLNGRL